MNVCHLHPRNGVVGVGVLFERIRRITGYLNGDFRRFNNAKRAEVRDRVKHMTLPSKGAAAMPAAMPPATLGKVA